MAHSGHHDAVQQKFFRATHRREAFASPYSMTDRYSFAE
jgi:hypothetical protein